MPTKSSLRDITQILTDLDEVVGSDHAEPVEDFVLSEAEEEEIAQLWAGDPGNQGS